eukprot:3885327-Alexandrium_andersonii.AAC.1
MVFGGPPATPHLREGPRAMVRPAPRAAQVPTKGNRDLFRRLLAPASGVGGTSWPMASPKAE